MIGGRVIRSRCSTRVLTRSQASSETRTHVRPCGVSEHADSRSARRVGAAPADGALRAPIDATAATRAPDTSNRRWRDRILTTLEGPDLIIAAVASDSRVTGAPRPRKTEPGRAQRVLLNVSELDRRLQSHLGTAYQMQSELGGGGMSRVFIADDVTLDRRVVVKVLNPNLAATVSIARFQREIMVVAKLNHPNIVPILSAGE